MKKKQSDQRPHTNNNIFILSGALVVLAIIILVVWRVVPNQQADGEAQSPEIQTNGTASVAENATKKEAPPASLAEKKIFMNILTEQKLIPDPQTDKFVVSISVDKEWAYGTLGTLNADKKQLTDLKQIVFGKENGKWKLFTGDLYQLPNTVGEIERRMPKDVLERFKYWLNIFD